MITLLKNFCKEESGQDLVEYALVLGFLALAAVAVLTTTGTSITEFWTTAGTKVDAAKTAATGAGS